MHASQAPHWSRRVDTTADVASSRDIPYSVEPQPPLFDTGAVAVAQQLY